MREICFFDLDGTLWNIKDDSIWVIDKEKPYKPLVTINQLDFSLIKSGEFKKHNLPLKYNGNTHYISPNLFNIIKKKSGSENIERFGISFMPLVKKEILDKKNADILLKNIEHLRYNKFVDIGILTARTNQKNHVNLLNNLRLELKKYDININKIYFVGKGNSSGNDIRKTHVLLEHLIGLKIKNDKFIPIKQDWYKKVSFYDDDFKNISTANNIQKYFNDIITKTDDETFKIIMERVKSYNLTLNTYLITNNELNRFKKNTINITEPIKYSILENKRYIKLYKQFI